MEKYIIILNVAIVLDKIFYKLGNKIRVNEWNSVIQYFSKNKTRNPLKKW